MSYKIEKKTEVTETKIYTCDVCGQKPGDYRCCICGDDLCLKCSIFDPREFGDYPDCFCRSCWKIGDYYRKEMNKLEIEHDKQIEGLEEAWKHEAIRKKEEKNGK